MVGKSVRTWRVEPIDSLVPEPEATSAHAGHDRTGGAG
jgi:hypothetical protein